MEGWQIFMLLGVLPVIYGVYQMWIDLPYFTPVLIGLGMMVVSIVWKNNS